MDGPVILDFGTTTQTFTVGEGAIAVPTVPTGLACYHMRLVLFLCKYWQNQHSKLCARRFQISKSCAYTYSIVATNNRNVRYFSEVVHTIKAGTLKEGEICYTPEMARFGTFY